MEQETTSVDARTKQEKEGAAGRDCGHNKQTDKLNLYLLISTDPPT